MIEDRTIEIENLRLMIKRYRSIIEYVSNTPYAESLND